MSIGDSNMEINLVDSKGNYFPVQDARMTMQHNGVSEIDLMAVLHGHDFHPGDMSIEVTSGHAKHSLPVKTWTVEPGQVTNGVTLHANTTFEYTDSTGANPWQPVPQNPQPGVQPFTHPSTERVHFDWGQKFERTIAIPEDMTVDEAHKLLTQCLVCEEPAHGLCDVCAEAVREARKQMVARWLMEFKEYEQASD